MVGMDVEKPPRRPNHCCTTSGIFEGIAKRNKYKLSQIGNHYEGLVSCIKWRKMQKLQIFFLLFSHGSKSYIGLKMVLFLNNVIARQ